MMSSHLLLRVIAMLVLPATIAAQPPRRGGAIARIDSLADAVLKNPVAGLSIAVVKGRDTLVMKGYGSARLDPALPTTARTVHRIGSVTKQFTAAAIMQLVEAGRLRLDDTLGTLLPQTPLPAHWRGVTLRQLLNHTSGIPSYTDVARFRPFIDTKLPFDTLFSLLRGDSLMFAPGTGFYYNNTGYHLLGIVIERVSGKPYAQHLHERVLEPLGLRSTSYCPNQPGEGHATGYDADSGRLVLARPIDIDVAYAGGGLCSTVSDLVAWTRALASGEVVSRASYEAMTTPVALRSPRRMTYGFGFARDTSVGTHRVIAHSGAINGFSSYVGHYPDDSLVVAVLANTRNAPMARLGGNIARAVLGLPLVRGPAPLADVATTPADRARIVGRYRVTQPDGSGRDARVEEVHGRLVLSMGADAPMRLQRQRDDVYAVVGGPPGMLLMFEVHDGKATGFILDARTSRPLPAVRVQ